MKINFRQTKDLKINEDQKETNSILEQRAVKILRQKDFFEKINMQFNKELSQTIKINNPTEK